MAAIADASADAPVDAARAAKALIDDALGRHPVVIFTKRECEYCGLAERTVAGTITRIARSPDCAEAKTHINPAVILLEEDSVGRKAREMLARRTGANTMPRVFLQGKCLGGATETVQLARTGVLAAAFQRIAGCRRSAAGVEK